MRARHHAHLVRQEVHSRNTPIMPLQCLHALKISRRPHYSSLLLLLSYPSPSDRTLRSPRTLQTHRTEYPESHFCVPAPYKPPSASADPTSSPCCRRSPSPATLHRGFRTYLEPVRREAAAQHSLRVALRVTAHRSVAYLQNQRAAPRSKVPHAAHARLIACRREAPVALK